ncbi:class A sortase [Fundicoccus culcitae]|uniref:Class A sortase n=1 Tax=Fundicoccus culcitae TaxID=2969821 RepID=A0ABY5P5E9_9LACT|nr:class A sortase [Fundicoccus culcitae]UUX33796.1 class A sortase [Fundicoccus culcitae]
MSEEKNPQSRSERRKKEKRKGGRFQTILGVILIIIAAALLAIDPIKNQIIRQGSEQNQIGNLTREEVIANQDRDVEYDWQAITNINAAEVLANSINPNDLPTIGGIAIPEVSMNLPIYKGVTNEGMYLGAGTLYPDMEMGESNYSIASHHSINEDLLFAPLMRVEMGDIIYLTDLENIYVYQVDYIDQVEPTRVDLVQPTVEPIVTLITCDYSLNERVVVQGSLVETVAIENASQEMLNAFNLPQTIPG